MIDLQEFFDAVRANPFGGKLLPGQVQGCEAILRACERHGVIDDRFVANTLAQVHHETGGQMLPVVENLTYSSAERIRAVWPSRFPTVAAAAPFVRNPQALAIKVYGDRLGNRAGTDDGWRFRGHCQIQITGRDHFQNFGDLLGVDLVGDPARALDLDVSAEIAVIGMRDGLFTGKSLGDYFSAMRDDPAGARAIVNGDVRANGPRIATLHRAFLAALQAAQADPVQSWLAAAPAPVATIKAWLAAKPEGATL